MKTFVMTSAVLLAVLASAQAGCKYKKGPWSDCDDQNLQTRTNTLKTRRGRLNYDASCDPSQVQTRACKCKYTAEEQPCDRTTNTLTITKTLNAAKSSVGCRPELNVTKQCKPPKACTYSRGEWTECDMKSDTVSKTSTLISGPDECQQKLTVYKKCRKACKYKKGSWGDCDQMTMIKERVDTLNAAASKDFCRATRTISKKCGKKSKKSKKGCVYDSGTWGDCDKETGLRSKTKTLISGDTNKCSVEKTVNKSCSRSNGEERCFFGKWQEWEGCRNGVQRKQRTVIQGGVECQRRGVKTRSCQPSW